MRKTNGENVTVRERLVLIAGKLRRLYYHTFRPNYVREKLKRRAGECNRCGACCLLGYTCTYFKRENGTPKCRIYHKRPENCHIFPLDERDIRERDIIDPLGSCGYYFNHKEQE